MPRSPLQDDGQVVTIDLHGRPVDVAEALILQLVRMAARRGRDRVRIIHGSSTSDARYRNRTIKHALLDLLETGRLDPWVTHAVPGEATTVLALPLGPPHDPTPLRMSDLEP